MKILIIIFLLASFNLLFAKSKFFSVNKSTQELCLISEDGSLQIVTNLDFVDESRIFIEYMKFNNSLYILKSSGEVFSYNLNSKEVKFLYTLNSNLVDIEGSWAGITSNSQNEIFVFNEIGGNKEGRLYKVTDINTGLVAPFTDNTSGSPSIIGIEYDNNNRIWNIEQCCGHSLNVLDGFRGQMKKLFKEPVSINFPQDLAFNEDTEQLMGVDIKNEFTATRTDFFFADRSTGKTDIFLSLEGNYNGIAELTIASSVDAQTNFEDKYKVYPNPVTNQFSIDVDNHVSDIIIYDLKGNIVKSNINSLKNVDVSNFVAGTYIVNFKINGRSQDRVFVKY